MEKKWSLEEELLSGLKKTEREGLIGEILTEMVAEQCFSNFGLLHRNWRRTGRANHEGMDFVGVWTRDGVERLTLVESKYGREVANPDSYVRTRIKGQLRGWKTTRRTR
ncbi:MAG: hypothetical protein ABSA92_13910 [Candidatus Bathyarchaeia archaeon]|jgi:hypothetical protein